MTIQVFSEKQISDLRAQYGAVERINPTGYVWERLEKFVSGLSVPVLQQLANASIRWVSNLCIAQLARKNGASAGTVAHFVGVQSGTVKPLGQL